MSRNKSKKITRLTGIFFVSLCYYFWGFLILFTAGIDEKADYLYSDPISLKYHHFIIKKYLNSVDAVYHSIYWAFLASTLLAVFIFKMVRKDKLTSGDNTHMIIRWSAISLIFLSYYLYLTKEFWKFTHIASERLQISLNEPIPLNMHRTIIQNISKSYDNFLMIPVWGFPICLILILLIFKKVR